MLVLFYSSYFWIHLIMDSSQNTYSGRERKKEKEEEDSSCCLSRGLFRVFPVSAKN